MDSEQLRNYDIQTHSLPNLRLLRFPERFNIDIILASSLLEHPPPLSQFQYPSVCRPARTCPPFVFSGAITVLYCDFPGPGQQIDNFATNNIAR